jgi:protocatechuate 3,4-dioxygenase beta subunit
VKTLFSKTHRKPTSHIRHLAAASPTFTVTMLLCILVLVVGGGFWLIAVIQPALAADVFSINVNDQVSEGVPAPGAGIIETPGETDIYTFRAITRQEVFFDLQEQSGVSDLPFRVEDSAGSTIIDTCLGCDDPGLLRLSQGGTYTITVGMDEGNQTGSYQFQLWNIIQDDFSIEIGDTITPDDPGGGSGVIETPGARDTYTFPAAPGQEVLFDLQEQTDVGHVSFRVVDEEGSEVVSTCLGCDNPPITTLTRGGTYTIIVNSAEWDDTGTYQFTIDGDPPQLIRGSVTDDEGTPVADVTISYGNEQTTTTDSNGDYAIGVTEEMTYTLTPSKENCLFEPESREVTLPGETSGQDFTARCDDFTISGSITDGEGEPLEGVSVSVGTDTIATDQDGSYTIQVTSGSYTVAPSSNRCTFSPSSLEVEVPPDATGQQFTATCEPETSTIAGTVVDDQGAPLEGVTLSNGAGQRTMTDSDGTYQLQDVAAGTFTMTPSKADCTFIPASTDVTVPPDASDVTFTATCTPTEPSQEPTPQPQPTQIPDDPYPAPSPGEPGVSGFIYLPLIASDVEGAPSLPPDTPSRPPVPGTPSLPVNVQAIAISATQIQVTWVDRADNEEGFVLDDDTERPMVRLPADASTYIFDGLTPGTRYCYEICAFNEIGFSNWTAWVCAFTP